uniref:Uncharacterized protein n=1 Tax=Oryzias melastigma TaxID=30732 RepID=A0A3B3D238_ORYME
MARPRPHCLLLQLRLYSCACSAGLRWIKESSDNAELRLCWQTNIACASWDRLILSQSLVVLRPKTPVYKSVLVLLTVAPERHQFILVQFQYFSQTDVDCSIKSCPELKIKVQIVQGLRTELEQLLYGPRVGNVSLRGRRVAFLASLLSVSGSYTVICYYVNDLSVVTSAPTNSSAIAKL